MAQAPNRDQLIDIPEIPLDEDGAVFNSPWEAKVFAMIVSLHQQGHFEWTEWAETISDEIEQDKRNPTESAYYQLWLQAAERIIDAKGLAGADELRVMKELLIAEQAQAHDHSH